MFKIICDMCGGEMREMIDEDSLLLECQKCGYTYSEDNCYEEVEYDGLL